MEKINIAELLKDCPKGMELDCTMYDNITFCGINKRSTAPINIQRKDGIIYQLTKYGQPSEYEDSKCVIFPKGKTTWEGFQRPFKDGDILTYTSNYTTTFIYRNKDNEPNFSTSFYVACNNAPSHNFLIYNKHTLIALNENCDVRLATEEEKAKLFQAIKDNGYKWNEEIKTLDKLFQPKFKVGDRVKSKISQYEYTIADIRKDVYIMYYATEKFGYHVPFCDEDKFDLVPDKFNIVTLVPFESKVLVRDYDTQIWIPTFWGKYLKDDSNCSYLTTNGCYKYCIPYEGNEHLLGTTDDCDEYFKTWK